jgi:hybrid cluster-associated redox disulfide protein
MTNKIQINKHMTISEVVELSPDAVDVFLEYGLHCVGCGASSWESIEDGASGHGMSAELIDQLVEELNEVV